MVFGPNPFTFKGFAKAVAYIIVFGSIFWAIIKIYLGRKL